MKKLTLIALIAGLGHLILVAQTGTDDYWLNNGFNNGDTVYTNTGWFYDDGGNDVYNEDQVWSVTFCSENGNPLTVDFSDFRTHFGGTVGDGTYTEYDYITVDYPGASYVAYHDNTPEFSFTSQSSCITVGFISNGDGRVDSGWVAEIYALPAPANNDPVDAEDLVVGNVCSPSFYSNKGAFNTTNLGNPACQPYFGGDVWFRAQVPASGTIKIETFEGTLDYAILDIFNSADADLLPSERIACVDDGGAMPSIILSEPLVSPGDIVYIRLFGEQAKSGLFGICASDPAAPVTGYTGPGGVGDSVSIDYWFKPETGLLNNAGFVVADNEAVRTWEDQSGNGNDLVQTGSGLQPVYAAGVHERYGALQFDGADDLFALESGSGDAPLHWFAAASFQGNQRQTMVSIGDAFADKTASLSQHSDGRYFSYTGGDLYGPQLTEGQFYIFNACHTSSVPYHFLELDGQSQVVEPDPLPLETDGTFRMGTSWDGGEPFAGRISELIQYRKTLNQAQEIIVNNYLSAKYNIPLSANDLYPYKTSFPFDVAGIGRVDAGNTHTRAMSAGILSVSGANDFDDNEFLFFGHDNGDTDAWSETGIPEGDTNIVRIARTWRVAVTGSPGSVSIGLNKTMLPGLPEGFAAYNILVDGDGDFSVGAKSYGPYEINNELVINNLEVLNGDYIAIAAVRPLVSFATDSTATPESVVNPVLKVVLNYPVSTTVEVNYEVTGGTAVQGEDFSLLDASISIDPGNRSGNILPLVIDDDVPEIPDEYFEVQISTTTDGVRAGGITRLKHVILNDDLEVEIMAPDTVVGACDESEAQLIAVATGTGPFTYEWTPSDGLNSTVNDTVLANPGATTDYTVAVTDSYGHTKQAQFTLHVNPVPSQPVVTADGSTSACEGDTVGLTAPGGFASYLWSTGESTREIEVISGGSYHVSVIDAFGCTSPASAVTTVTINQLPAPPVITYDGPLEFCEGEEVTLTVVGDYVAYSWNDGTTGKTRTADKAGSYTVFVEDANGCFSAPSDTSSVSVHALPEQPVITPAGPHQIDIGDSILLTSTTASTYLWSPGGATSRSIYASEAGDYAVIVENEFGCQGPPAVPVRISVSDFLPPPVVTYNAALSFCTGGSVTLSGPGGFSSYTWSNGTTGREITVTDEGMITLVVADQEGTKSRPSEPLQITVYEKPQLVVDAMSMPLCNGDANGSLTVAAEGGAGPYSYTWMEMDVFTESIGSLTAGTYFAMVEDSNGCRDTLEIGLAEPGPVQTDVDVTAAYCPDFSDGSVELTGTTGGTPPYQVIWSDGRTGSYLSDLPPGDYSYLVEDQNGCTAGGSVSVQYLQEACFVVPGIITPNQDGYNDYWRIDGLGVYPDVTIEVYDRWGRRVFYSEGYDTLFDGTFDGKELPMESYHYIIDLHNGTAPIIGNLTIIR